MAGVVFFYSKIDRKHKHSQYAQAVYIEIRSVRVRLALSGVNYFLGSSTLTFVLCPLVTHDTDEPLTRVFPAHFTYPASNDRVGAHKPQKKLFYFRMLQ